MGNDYFKRAANRVSARKVAQHDQRIRDAEKAAHDARKSREEALEHFWSEFDKIFSPGDPIQWFDGFDLRQSTYRNHTKWHVNVALGNSSMGLPIVIDQEFEKVVT